MNTILEDVFLHDDVRGGKAVGFITAGLGAPGQRIGYTVTLSSLKACWLVTPNHPDFFLTPSHLRTIADRLQHLNERQEKARQKSR